MTYLDNLVGVDTGKDSVEKRDSLHKHAGRGNLHSVTDIEGVLDEQEDAGTQELLAGSSEDERQREQCSSRSSQASDERASEAGNYQGLLVRDTKIEQRCTHGK